MCVSPVAGLGAAGKRNRAVLCPRRPTRVQHPQRLRFPRIRSRFWLAAWNRRCQEAKVQAAHLIRQSYTVHGSTIPYSVPKGSIYRNDTHLLSTSTKYHGIFAPENPCWNELRSSSCMGVAQDALPCNAPSMSSLEVSVHHILQEITERRSCPAR